MQTEEIIDQLEQLNRRSSALDMPEAERIAMWNRVAEYANTFIGGLSGVKGFVEKPVHSLEIGEGRRDIQALLNLYQAEVAENGINAA